MPDRNDHAQFRPPRPNSFIIKLVGWTLPRILRMRDVVAVECSEEDLDRLRALRGERVAILPNHPTGVDPAILFHVSKLVRQPFHYLSAREVFDLFGGAWGWLIQRVGAYSIVRGTPDRAAFKMTRELLVRPGMKLVMFPEGETYSQNDSLLPFHGGVTQFVLWAQDDLAGQGDASSIYVLPVAVKYRFVEDVEPAIRASVSRLEQSLALEAWAVGSGVTDQAADGDLYPRLRRIGAHVVAKLEPQYGVSPSAGAALAERMDGLKSAIVARVAGALGVPPRGETLPDRMRHLINALYEVTDEHPRDLCDYDGRLWEDRRQRLQPLMRDLDRLANWIAVYDGYVSAHPTMERMAELIWRLEVEVFGPPPIGVPVPRRRRTPRLSGKRRCIVRIGAPIQVATYRDQYNADKRRTVAELTRQVEAAVQALLADMA